MTTSSCGSTHEQGAIKPPQVWRGGVVAGSRWLFPLPGPVKVRSAGRSRILARNRATRWLSVVVWARETKARPVKRKQSKQAQARQDKRHAAAGAASRPGGYS
ncbi:hypothetical protein ON010_g10812 [Phytophthora cinnamomi]|nr:hypothetical protein ON010_g10812 [Phytophthora cinnamomi]